MSRVERYGEPLPHCGVKAPQYLRIIPFRTSLPSLNKLYPCEKVARNERQQKGCRPWPVVQILRSYRDSMVKGRGKDRKSAEAKEGLGGIVKTIGSFLDLLSDMVEKGETEVRRDGEVELGQRKGVKAVYGFSVRLGGEGRPKVEPFGNVRRERERGPVVEEVREPIVDVFDEKEAVVVVAELPGINEEDITVELRDDILTIAAETGEQKYYKEVLLEVPITCEGLTRSYRNGILEIRICKKQG